MAIQENNGALGLGEKVFERRYNFGEAMGWNLYNTSLSYELTDRTELDALEEIGQWFSYVETEAEFSYPNADPETGAPKEIVVRFRWETEAEQDAKAEASRAA